MVCTYKIFAQHMNEMVSIAMLTLLSIDRYIAILSSTNRTQLTVQNFCFNKIKKMVIANLSSVASKCKKIQIVDW